MTGTLVATLAFLCVIGWWQTSTRAREQAAVYVESACREAGVQWLDATVVFRRYELVRDRDGSRHLRRTYVFEYCDDGVSRHQGFIAMRGLHLEWVGFGPTAVDTVS